MTTEFLRNLVNMDFFKELDDLRICIEFWSEFCWPILSSNHSDDYGILQNTNTLFRKLDDHRILIRILFKN